MRYNSMVIISLLNMQSIHCQVKASGFITLGLAAPSRPKEDGVEAERMKGFHQRPKCIDIASALISGFFVC